jgi:hypothetical protein
MFALAGGRPLQEEQEEQIKLGEKDGVLVYTSLDLKVQNRNLGFLPAPHL